MGKYSALIKRLQASPAYEAQYQMRLKELAAMSVASEFSESLERYASHPDDTVVPCHLGKLRALLADRGQDQLRIQSLSNDVARLTELYRNSTGIAPPEEPTRQCNRCGKTFPESQLTPEEGDEWECLPCNARENARERAEATRLKEDT